MMFPSSLIAWLSVCASAISLALGLAVYLLNKKETLNKLFMVTLIFNAYWAFAESMMYQANNVQIAYFWNQVMVLWPFWASLILHFTLVFTESNLLKQRPKTTYAAIYLPAAVFAVIDLTTDWISALPVKQIWGYTFTAQDGLASTVMLSGQQRW
jgi:hypothetical protein